MVKLAHAVERSKPKPDGGQLSFGRTGVMGEVALSSFACQMREALLLVGLKNNVAFFSQVLEERKKRR